MTADAAGGVAAPTPEARQQPPQIAVVPDAAPPVLRVNVDGPHEIPLTAGRPIWYALPGAGDKPVRLVAHLHGMCGPPSYACGKWIEAGTDVGAMVCPTGNARCGDSPYGPPSWEAASWEELVVEMDRDLEASIAKVIAKHPGVVRRDGAVLTGYSRGAYAAAVIARMHPGRWPYLVLIEARVPLGAASLRKAGVRAVALVAGEVGTEVASERKTQEELERAGFPARLFVMPGAGHLYSDDMERVMADALAYVLAQSTPDR
jgi:pimeloyl-ACP methyl ester carboxylesterase